ncbi:Polysaccharide deacetylase, caspase activity [Minicystis rosea]|nr:Polysaccharide deacetylase, caspase activity [Minicystis rosea]
MNGHRVLLALALLAAGCDDLAAETTAEAPTGVSTAPPAAASASASAGAPTTPPARPQLDGRAFPEKVLALTWDDGPDAGTLELADYLHREGVSATFFVVSEWVEGVSSEPGEGHNVLDTGHARLPILGDLVALGHRLGNHTRHHVLLNDADAATVAAELRENQAAIDPWTSNDLHLFRVPGGAWNAAASAAVEADPITRNLVGPIRWDIDGKDWESSLYCRSSRPALECEPAAPGHGARVKPAVVARRYLAAIESARRGIVLFHDRVGHVGSHYALDLAHLVIPELLARGYVFAAPVLAFSRPALRAGAPRRTPAEDALADVDGDGKPDHCSKAGAGIACTPSRGSRRASPTAWTAGEDFADADTVRFGDINGDHRADVCARTRAGIACALSTGHAFTRASIWLRADDLAAAGLTSAEAVASLQLGDVDGDGRADLCGQSAAGRLCALAP